MQAILRYDLAQNEILRLFRSAPAGVAIDERLTADSSGVGVLKQNLEVMKVQLQAVERMTARNKRD